MSLLRFVFAPLFAAGVAAPVWADSPLTLSSMTVTRHDTLVNYDTDTGLLCCARQVYLSGEDVDFIYVDADFDLAWSDDLDSVSYNSREILLQLPGAVEPIQAWWRVSFVPHVESSGPSIRARKPRDFPEETAGAYLNAVFSIPPGVGSATLLIGPEDERLSLNIAIPAGESEMPSPTDFVAVTADALTRLPQLATSERRGPVTLAGIVKADIGQVLALDITVQALANADTDSDPGENRVLYYNTSLSLVGPEGLPLVPLGQEVNGGLANDYSNSISWDTDPARTYGRQLYFLGSGAPGTYRLFYLDQEVGQIDLP